MDIPHTDPASIPDLVAGLRRTFDSGRTRSLDWRREQLEGLRTLVKEEGDTLVEALRADFGKPTLEAWITDVASVSNEASLALKNLKRWTRNRAVPTPLEQKPGRSYVRYEPLGVVLVIAPWNYPVQLLLAPLVGAVAAGNCAVLKPSEITAHTSATLARIVPRYVDPEAVAVVEGGVAETTALLEERFDHIFYTGNGTVGRVVMQAAAKHLTPVTLELGGKSPCIVDETADLDVAARRIAWGKFLNAGQTCIAPDYVLVHESREEELLGKLEGVVKDFYGDDPQKSEDYARISNDRHHERLSKLLESGEVVFGGRADAESRYLAPTVLRDVRPDSPAMQEEIFGPILPVIRVGDLDEAIAFVNGREKPLALYLFSAKDDAEEAVVERTSSGGVCVNATLWHIANPNLPFGGIGPSGMGAYHGRASFETFSHPKPVMAKPTWLDPRIVYPPYTRLKKALVRRFLG